eukprot:COSAG02_NODE_2780_length_8045_cov_78.691040_2_plen_74_part_00
MPTQQYPSDSLLSSPFNCTEHRFPPISLQEFVSFSSRFRSISNVFTVPILHSAIPTVMDADYASWFHRGSFSG